MKVKIILCRPAVLILLLFFITCSKDNTPVLSVNETFYNFTKIVHSGDLIISNSGEGELSWEITDKPNWLETSKSSGIVTNDNDTVVVIADVNQELGTYSGTINIESNGGNQIVEVSLIIDIWVEATPMPTARFWASSEVVNGKIYVIGGAAIDGAPALATVEEYDPLSNTWKSKQNMPTPRCIIASAMVDGKIYIFGGDRNFQSHVTNGVRTLEVYDPTNDIWDTTKTPMPTARSSASASAVNDIIYVIGGATPGGAASNEVEAYNPVTDTWETKSPMPTARWALSTEVVDGKIYAMGSGQRGINTRVEEYDPATDTWTQKAYMLVSNGYFGTGVIDGIIYAVGGSWSAGSYYSRVDAYDPSTDEWSAKTPMPTARFALCAGVFNEKIYAIGGGRSQVGHLPQFQLLKNMILLLIQNSVDYYRLE